MDPHRIPIPTAAMQISLENVIFSVKNLVCTIPIYSPFSRFFCLRTQLKRLKKAIFYTYIVPILFGYSLIAQKPWAKKYHFLTYEILNSQFSIEICILMFGRPNHSFSSHQISDKPFVHTDLGIEHVGI